MPLSGDTAAFGRFVREMHGGQKFDSSLGRAIMQAVKGELQARIKDQFRRGVGPDDSTQPPRKDGKPALVSRRLGNAARARVAGSAVYVEPKTAKAAGILDTQQEGHVFPARQARGGAVFLNALSGGFLSRRGRRAGRRNKRLSYVDIARGRLLIAAMKNKTNLLGRKVSFRGHEIGVRTLRPRHIRPVAGLPLPWQSAIGRGFQSGMDARIGKFAE